MLRAEFAQRGSSSELFRPCEEHQGHTSQAALGKRPGLKQLTTLIEPSRDYSDGWGHIGTDTLIDMLARLGVGVRLVLKPKARRVA